MKAENLLYLSSTHFTGGKLDYCLVSIPTASLSQLYDEVSNNCKTQSRPPKIGPRTGLSRNRTHSDVVLTHTTLCRVTTLILCDEVCVNRRKRLLVERCDGALASWRFVKVTVVVSSAGGASVQERWRADFTQESGQRGERSAENTRNDLSDSLVLKSVVKWTYHRGHTKVQDKDTDDGKLKSGGWRWLCGQIWLLLTRSDSFRLKYFADIRLYFLNSHLCVFMCTPLGEDFGFFCWSKKRGCCWIQSVESKPSVDTSFL